MKKVQQRRTWGNAGEQQHKVKGADVAQKRPGIDGYEALKALELEIRGGYYH